MSSWVAPSTRFSKTSFSAKHDWSQYPTTSYTCPSCHANTELALRDFDKYAQSRKVLDEREDLARLFQVLPEIMRSWGNSILPMWCSGCSSPVLILFDASESHILGRCYWLSWVVEAAGQQRATQSGSKSGGAA